MNKESNNYTILYASVMVIIVAIGLAFTSSVLRDRQKKNEDIDKMRQILRAINIQSTDKDADKKYAEFVVSATAVDEKGTVVSEDGFGVDLVAEMKKPAEKRQYPVYESKIDGKTYYIMAMRGAGLWGPIWGYISVAEDKNTVFGADFSHAGETPGLGAEIVYPKFSNQFVGKEIFKNGVFKSIAVVKNGNTKEDQDYVDGISGGTITSQGVSQMLSTSLQPYAAFLTK